MNLENYNYKYVYFLTFVTAMGGLLFGYDWVVIGGTKPFYELYFAIENSPSLQGWAVSSALVGCVVGAAVSGVIADTLGRKVPLIISALLFIISAFGSGYVDHLTPFIIYRIIGGVGIGLASTLSPMYIAEIAPARLRGRLVSVNQLTIVIGILLAQLVNYFIAEPLVSNSTPIEIRNSWNGQMGWRWMFMAEIIPAFLFFVLMLFVPKSPRYLAKIQAHDKALEVLEKLGGRVYAQQELKIIEATLDDEKSRKKVNLKDLTDRKVRPILIIGVVLAIFQQWCGINVIFNYAQEIFTAAGYDVGEMLFNIIITGSVNLIFTIVALRVVDKLGRRKLLLIGSIGLAVVYLVLGMAYFLEFSGWPVLILVITAIAIYAMSLAPVTWVVISEIFPNRIRGVAMSIATLSLWIASFVLTFSFPALNQYLGSFGTFWIYSFICVVGYIFIKQKLPETKEKSLEEIEIEFTKNYGNEKSKSLE